MRWLLAWLRDMFTPRPLDDLGSTALWMLRSAWGDLYWIESPDTGGGVWVAMCRDGREIRAEGAEALHQAILADHEGTHAAPSAPEVPAYRGETLLDVRPHLPRWWTP